MKVNCTVKLFNTLPRNIGFGKSAKQIHYLDLRYSQLASQNPAQVMLLKRVLSGGINSFPQDFVVIRAKDRDPLRTSSVPKQNWTF